MSLDPHQATAMRSPSQEDCFRSVLDSMADVAVIATDARGGVVVWNAGAVRLFGYAADEVAGSGVEVLFTPEDRAMGVPEMEKRRALASGQVEHQRWLVHRNGSRFWSAVLTTPLAGGAGGFVRLVRNRTEQRRADEDLLESEALLRATIAGMPQMVFRSFATGERTWHGPQWQDHTGLSDRGSTGFGWLDAIHPEDRAATLQAWTGARQAGFYLVEHRIHHAGHGGHRWHQTRAVPRQDTGGEWVGSSTDVHAMRGRIERLAHAGQQMRTLLEGIPQLVWRSLDAGCWTWSGPQWQRYTGLDEAASQGQGWLAAVHPDDRAGAMDAWMHAPVQGRLDVEVRLHRAADGGYAWHRIRATPVLDAAGNVVEWLGTATEVDGQKELERQLEERREVESALRHTAFHDDLTGLHNRAFFMDRLRRALDRRGEPAFRCAVLFLDLDRFKLVNDSMGHGAGNLLLVEAARRLEGCLRPQDTLARMGGDEFAVLAEGFDHIAEVEATAERITAAMRRPCQLGTEQVFPSCSVGLAEMGHEDGPEDLLRNADIAMYQAKRRNPGSYALRAAL